MRVVHVIDSLAPGGAERSLAELAPHLVARGLSLEFVVLHDGPGLADELRAAGSLVHAVGGSTRLAWVREVRALLKASPVDLVHTTLFDGDVIGRVAARLAGTPVVSSLVNTPYGPEHLAEAGLSSPKLRAAQLTDMATARLACRFRAVSEAVKDAYVSRLHLRPHLVDVIPEGRDPDKLGTRTPARRAAARARLGVGDEPVVLAIGRQDPQKGFDVLLRAVPAVRDRVPEVKLFVAGRPGRSSALLRSMESELGLSGSVRFLGHREDAADLLCAADLFVLPSRREGIPGALQEAMALEVPIVATGIGPVREALDDPELAELVEPEDPAALAGAIIKVLSSAGGNAARTAGARQRFLSAYAITTIADRLVVFYQTALEGQRNNTRSRRLPDRHPRR